MGLSIGHLLLILIIVFVLFGAGKLPKVMGDVGRGVRALRDGLKGDEATSEKEIAQDTTPKTIIEAVDDHTKRSG